MDQGSLQDFLKSGVYIHFANTGCCRHIISMNKTTEITWMREISLNPRENSHDKTNGSREHYTYPSASDMILIRADLLTVEKKN